MKVNTMLGLLSGTPRFSTECLHAPLVSSDEVQMKGQKTVLYFEVPANKVRFLFLIKIY